MKIRHGLWVSAILCMVVLGSCSTMMAQEEARRARRLEAYKNERRAEILARREQVLAERAQVQAATAEPAPVDPYLALNFPRLPNPIALPGDLDAVLNAFKAHVEVTAKVRDEIYAFGLRPQLRQIQRLRVGTQGWQDYWKNFTIFPTEPELKKTQVEAFYTAIGELDASYQVSLGSINEFINKERSKPWTGR